MRAIVAFPALVSLCFLASAPASLAALDAGRASLVAEVSAGPTLGLDRFLRGCLSEAGLGFSWAPFEADLRVGASYDAALGQGALDLDIALSLGKNLRAIIGCLFPLGPLALETDSGSVLLEASSWPNRFGLEATLAEISLGRAGLKAGLKAEPKAEMKAELAAAFVYEDLRVPDGASSAASRLSGARAFAACVEAELHSSRGMAPSLTGEASGLLIERMTTLTEASAFVADARLAEAARIAISSSLKLREGETILIVANPERESFETAAALYDAAVTAGGRPSLVIQPVKAQTDYAEEAVIAAFESQPEVFVSLSAEKLGKDRGALRTPYEWNGTSYDHIFHYQLYGAKTLRAFWSPGATRSMFAKAVPIDYEALKRRCDAVEAALRGASRARITSPLGTDLVVGLSGRRPKRDDGDFSRPGSGGNLPAGEVFISPALGASSGTIVFDLSIAAVKGDIVIREPIVARVEGGFVVEVSGGSEAASLRAALDSGEEAARALGNEGSLPSAKTDAYIRNARNLGELGIGLNPAAEIVGNMLEDEKAFHTCHFAIGANYDEDAPALIHLDGLVSRPTIVVTKEDGSELSIEREGELVV